MGPNKFVHLTFALGGAAGGVRPVARDATGCGATSPSPTIWSSTASPFVVAGDRGARRLPQRDGSTRRSSTSRASWRRSPGRRARKPSAATIVVIVTVLISAAHPEQLRCTLVILHKLVPPLSGTRDRLMPMKWYVVHTYSGHENKAKLSLQDRVRQAGLHGEVRRHPHPDRHRRGAGEGPEALDHPQVLPGLHVRPDGSRPGDLPPGQEHARRSPASSAAPTRSRSRRRRSRTSTSP